MFLPIGDTPNPRGTAWVNNLLIGANIGVFLLVSLPLVGVSPDLSDPLLLEYLRALGARGQIPVEEILRHVSAYDLVVFRYGFKPDAPSVLTLFTAMFLHGGLLHLAGNMLFLWIFGNNVEAKLGHFGYLLAYLGTGIAATLFFALFVSDSMVPLVGASGAISGVLGCYFLWFPRNQVRTFVFLFPFIMTTFLIPARLVLGVYLVLDNILPFLLDAGGGSGVAHGAHIGGFLAGLGLATAERRFPFGREVPQGEAAARDYGAAQVARSLQAGNIGQATLRFLALSEEERRRVASTDLLAIGEYLLDRRDNHGALGIFRRFIAERPNDPELDRAYLGAGTASGRLPRGRAAAAQYFLAALDVARSQRLTEEARQRLRALEG